jgi:hypothetical protein
MLGTLRAAIEETNEEGLGAEIDFSNRFKGDLASPSRSPHHCPR